MTANAQLSEEVGPDAPTTGIGAEDFRPEPGATRLDIPIGHRVMVVSDLLLTPEATRTTLAVTEELARALDTWDGPGLLIIAGNLFDLTDATSLAEDAHRSIEAHQSLHQAFTLSLIHI